eukprot:GGOE01019973.1.p1 GENE.GGOE01019973.1~~GGOE01019973.1.p1  ORF type:complete len:594 (+),score=122.64 GGOE01019973.1:50-1783(+)
MNHGGPWQAPCKYDLPSNLNSEHLLLLFHRMTVNLMSEIFTLSSKSVLYELAHHGLQQRPSSPRRAAASETAMADLFRSFSQCLRQFEHRRLLAECRTLFINHLEARLTSIRFQSAVETLLPEPDSRWPDASDPMLDHPLGHCCFVEEIDGETWYFKDEGEGYSSNSSTSELTQRLRLGATAKVAYTVTLFVWAAVRLLSRRIELLQEFPPDHPLFTPTRTIETMKISSLGDSFQALLRKTKEAAQAAWALKRKQNWHGAIGDYSRAIALSPEGDEDRHFLYQYRAGCHFHLGQYPEAIEDCTTALSYNPRSYKALYRRAQSYEALGQQANALQDVRQMLRLYPGSSHADALRARLVQVTPSSPLRPPVTQLLQVPEGGAASDISTPARSQSLESPGNPCNSPLHGTPLQGEPAASTDGGTTPPCYSSLGTCFCLSSEMDIDLTVLPPFPEPPFVDDRPYLTAFIDSGAELEYLICGDTELGRGGYGRVYKAVNPTGGWFMAVKEISMGCYGKTEEDAMLLQRRVALLVTMKHVNVVRYLGCLVVPGYYHVAMEYCSGGSGPSEASWTGSAASRRCS